MSLISTLPTGVIEHLNLQFSIYGYEVICKCTLDMQIMVIYLFFFFIFLFMNITINSHRNPYFEEAFVAVGTL